MCVWGSYIYFSVHNLRQQHTTTRYKYDAIEQDKRTAFATFALGDAGVKISVKSANLSSVEHRHRFKQILMLSLEAKNEFHLTHARTQSPDSHPHRFQ